MCYSRIMKPAQQNLIFYILCFYYIFSITKDNNMTYYNFDKGETYQILAEPLKDPITLSNSKQTAKRLSNSNSNILILILLQSDGKPKPLIFKILTILKNTILNPKFQRPSQHQVAMIKVLLSFLSRFQHYIQTNKNFITANQNCISFCLLKE